MIANGLDVTSQMHSGGIVLQPDKIYSFYIDERSYKSFMMGYANGGPTVFSDSNLLQTRVRPALHLVIVFFLVQSRQLYIAQSNRYYLPKT